MKGFTLIELLAVIVILAIILLISVPVIGSIIQNVRIRAFEINAQNIIDNLEKIRILDSGLSLSSVNENNIKDYINADIDNYSSISVSEKNGDIYINIEGTKGWKNLTVCGTKEQLYTNEPEKCEEITDLEYTETSCFAFNEEHGAITGYDDSCPKDIVIPNRINGIDVKMIATDYPVICGNDDEGDEYIKGPFYVDNGEYDYCYTDDIGDLFINKNITSVVLPDYLEYIGQAAFSMNQITNINLPASLKYIGDDAFAANLITNLFIPNSVEYLSGFTENQLTSIIIPNNVNIIGQNAFGYNQITSVIIPNSVTKIKGWAFTENQLTSVTLSNNLKKIEYAAFALNQLTDIILPDGLLEIEGFAFGENLLTSVIIPGSVESVAGFDYNQLNSITLGSGIKVIGQSAFRENQLTNITIPNSVTTIAHSAFYNNLLTSVYIPNSVTSIEHDAFRYNHITQGNAQIDNSSGNYM